MFPQLALAIPSGFTRALPRQAPPHDLGNETKSYDGVAIGHQPDVRIEHTVNANFETGVRAHDAGGGLYQILPGLKAPHRLCQHLISAAPLSTCVIAPLRGIISFVEEHEHLGIQLAERGAGNVRQFIVLYVGQ